MTISDAFKEIILNAQNRILGSKNWGKSEEEEEMKGVTKIIG